MEVKVKKLKNAAVIPTYGSEKSAGVDLYACLDVPVTIKGHSTKLIGTGLSFEPPEGYYGAIYARSGIASKKGLRPANCVGVCDEDYRGEYMVALHNDSRYDQVVEPGDKIAQLLFVPYEQVQFEEVEELSDTVRSSGGFGSTGK